MQKIQVIVRFATASAITLLLVFGFAAGWDSTPPGLALHSVHSKFIPPVFAASCNYDDNLDTRAQEFIGACCLGSVNREFPGEYLNVTLATIKSEKSNGVGNAIKAYKLLNDNRFRK